MIARVWHERIPVSAGGDDLAMVRQRMRPSLLAASGNRGVWCLHRNQGATIDLHMMTFWNDADGIGACGGSDSVRPLDLETQVHHYDVFTDGRNDQPGVPHERRDAEHTTARVWQGQVPIHRADGYWAYLTDLGFRDYRGYPGHYETYLLRRTEERIMHVLLLSFWSSREAIVAYAGVDVSRARYYAYDLECLIDPPPTVEHYRVLFAPR